MSTRYGVTNGLNVYPIVDTPEVALALAQQAVKDDGMRRWVVRVVTLKRVTSVAQTIPEPLVEDE